MTIRASCGECGTTFRFADDRAGSTSRCKACGARLEIPGGSGARGSKRSGKKKSSSHGLGIVLGMAAIGVLFMVGAAVFIMPRLFRGNAAAAPIAADPAAPVSGATDPAAPSIAGQPQPPSVAPAATANAAAPTATPIAANTPSAPAAGSGFQKSIAASDRLTFSKVGEWSVVPNPAKESLEFSAPESLKVPLDPKNLRGQAVIFPVAPSEFVAVRKSLGSRAPIDVFSLVSGRKTGSAPELSFSGEMALSPDGRYLSTSLAGGTSIDVYDIKDKKSLGQLPTGTDQDKFSPAVLAMPTPERLVGISSVNRGVKIWEIPSGKLLAHIKGGDKFSSETAFAFSPGADYIAVQADYLTHQLDIYELATGKLAGSIQIDGQTSSIELNGVAFSRDGTELALVYDISFRGNLRDTTQFVVWDVAKGEIIKDFDLTPRLKEQLDPPYKGERLEPFPGSHRWLVHSRGIVDSDAESLVFGFPPQEGIEVIPSRRVMGGSWVAAVAFDKGAARLEPAVLDEELIASSRKSMEAGGLASDAGLPELTAIDFSTAPAVVPSATWAVSQATPAEPVKLANDVKIAIPEGIVREFVLNRGTEAFAAVRAGIDENLDDPRLQSVPQLLELREKGGIVDIPSPIAKATAVSVHQLESGQEFGRVTVPFSADLLAVSPSGKFVLVKQHEGQGRLDVFQTTGDAAHVLGWRPYRGEKDESSREVEAAAFLDDEHVVTLGKGYRLVVWSLARKEAVWQSEEVRRFAVSPGGSLLAVVTGNILGDRTLAFFNAKSGEAVGELPIEGHCPAIAFHETQPLLATSQGDEANKVLNIVNLTSGETVAKFPVPATTARLDWMGDRYLLMSGSLLVSLDLEGVVWSYRGVKTIPPSSHAVGGRYEFLTEAGKNVVLRSVNLPDEATAAKFDREALVAKAIVKPGDSVAVRLAISGEPELAKLREGADALIRERLEASGLNAAEQAPNVLEVQANLKTDGTRMLSKIGDRSVSETITIKRVSVDLIMKRGNEVIWRVTRPVSNVDRFLVRLNPGEAAQAGCDRLLIESLDGLMQSLKLPSFVFGKDSAQGFGQSALTSAK